MNRILAVFFSHSLQQQWQQEIDSLLVEIKIVIFNGGFCFSPEFLRNYVTLL